MSKQTKLTPVDDLESTITQPYLSKDDLKTGDKIEFIQLDDTPIMWSEPQIFTDDEGNEKPVTTYKVMVRFEDQEYELRLNNTSRKEISLACQGQLKNLPGKVGTVIKAGVGTFKHIHFSSIE